MEMYQVTKKRFSPQYQGGWYCRTQVDYRTRRSDVTSAVNYAKQNNASADKYLLQYGRHQDRYAVRVVRLEYSELDVIETVCADVPDDA